MRKNFREKLDKLEERLCRRKKKKLLIRIVNLEIFYKRPPGKSLIRKDENGQTYYLQVLESFEVNAGTEEGRSDCLPG
jgi:hypothetical protein